MKSYKENLFHPLLYWTLLSIPIVYFSITFFYQFVLAGALLTYMEIDPITLSIILSAFLSLSKPLGGLIFGVAFWSTSRLLGYERNIKTYMIISGWGILLIFSANEAGSLIVVPILLSDFQL